MTETRRSRLVECDSVRGKSVVQIDHRYPPQRYMVIGAQHTLLVDVDVELLVDRDSPGPARCTMLDDQVGAGLTPPANRR